MLGQREDSCSSVFRACALQPVKYWDAIDTISCKKMLKIPKRQHCITLHLFSALRSQKATFDINAK